MHRFEDTVMIEGRTPQEVFDYISDPDNGDKWISSVKEVHAEGEPGPGRKLHAKAGLMGVTFDAEQEVTTFDPPHAYGWAGDKPFHVAFEFRMEAAEGGTKLTGTVEVDPGKFLPVGGKLVARQLKKQFDKDVERLRSLLER
jgi:carbon monoxide dehydrogenase subunit G